MKKHIKITYSILGVTAGALLLLASGCSKQEQPSDATKTTSPPASETPKPAEAPTPPAQPAQPAAAAIPAPTAPATEVAPAAAVPAQPAMGTAATQAVATAATTTNLVQTLIEKAKGMVANEKYKDALTVVQQLSRMKLSGEQQTLVDGLKAQIQTALAQGAATNAASALGNILGGNK